jgi:hypothetical protein
MVAAAALAIVCLAGPVWARLGGGEGYGGDGGGGDGGGGGGRGAIQFIIWWINVCYNWPQIGLPTTLVVIVIIVLSHRKGLNLYQNSVITRSSAVVDSNRVAQCRAAMLAADPQFNEEDFYRRIKTAFMKLQAAWCLKDLSSVRAFISDGIHERLDIQFQEMKALDVTDVMNDIQVRSIQLAEVTSDDVFDVATVRVAASAVDYRITTSTGQRHDGPTTAEPFVEFWSFMRRHGVKTDSTKPGLMEGHCPNCGAAIEMNQLAQCAQCKSLLRSGQFDWVLAVITQGSEWRPQRRTQVAGGDELRTTDPGFNRVDVEDRASVMFWRKVAADRIGKIDPLRKVASDDLCAYLAKMGTATNEGRSYLGDCAVGSAHLLAVLPAEVDKAEQTPLPSGVLMAPVASAVDGPMDRAVVEIWWEGQPFQQRPNGQAVPVGQRKKMHQLYVLSRKPGVSSDPGKSVSSAHCPNCGGPVISDLSNACSFCGTVLNDGTRGWVLTRIEWAASTAGCELMSRVDYQWGHSPAPGRPSLAAAPPSGLLAWAVRTAMADGVIDLNEEELLERLGARCGLSAARVRELVAMAQQGGLELSDPPDRDSARQYLSAMAAMTVADGVVNDRELAFLSAAGRRFGFGSAEISGIVRAERANRLADARDQLRMAKEIRRDGDGN